MSDGPRPTTTPPPDGDDRSAQGRRLERAPGDRYTGRTPQRPSATSAPVPGRPPARRPTTAPVAPAGDTAPAEPRPRRALGLAILAALVGGAVVFAIGNLDLGSGLVALSAAVGWTTGLALTEGGGRGGSWPKSPIRPILGGGLAAAGVTGAMLALGLYAQVEGGVLPPVDYLAQRFGPLPLIDIVAAGLAGAVRAR